MNVFNFWLEVSGLDIDPEKVMEAVSQLALAFLDVGGNKVGVPLVFRSNFKRSSEVNTKKVLVVRPSSEVLVQGGSREQFREEYKPLEDHVLSGLRKTFPTADVSWHVAEGSMYC